MLKCALFYLTALAGELMATDFDSIVRNNVGNPVEIISKLKEIRDSSEIADAFLYNFGGDGFTKETSVTKSYSSEIMEHLVEAAFAIGSEMRKKGRSVADEVTDLKISKKFLEFADMNGNHGQVDNDVSSSFWKDQLNGMISVRQDYKDALEKLGELKSDSESD